MRPAPALTLASALLVLTACAGDDPADPGATDTTTMSTDSPTRTEGAPPTATSPATSGPVSPDMLVLRATDAPAAGACAPKNVTASLTPIEPALGHRYARVIVRNDSAQACTLVGFPGVGGPGESGDRLEIAAEQRQRTGEDDRARRVTVAPAAVAYANVEWTGDLAGAETERMTVLAVQLARGQRPAAVTTAESLDIGNGTTVRIGPWEQQPTARAARRCKSGPRRTADGVKRFWTKDRRCYTSRWFAGAHRTMIPYGCTRAPWYAASSQCRGGRGFHHGVDVDMPKGTRVYAGVAGRIVTRGIGAAYGSRAVIIRSRGRDILLGHLRSRAVRHGERVRKGDLIGRSGARGAPDGPHLHLEVRPARGSYADAVNPRRVLRLRRVRAAQG